MSEVLALEDPMVLRKDRLEGRRMWWRSAGAGICRSDGTSALDGNEKFEAKMTRREG